MYRHTKTMQMTSWLLGRARRVLPTVLAFFIIYILYKYMTKPSTGRNTRLVGSTSAPTPPPLPPTPRPMNRWLLLEGYTHTQAEICSKATMVFTGWNILAVANDSFSVKSCRDGWIRTTLEISQDFPNIQFSPSQQLLWSILAAVQNGAEVVYLPSKTWMETPNENPGVVLDRSFTGLLYKSHQTRTVRDGKEVRKVLEFFSYRRHFGCQDAVQGEGYIYDLCEQQLPAIQAPAALPVSDFKEPPCDPRAAPVTLPSGVFIDGLQLKTALYTQDAFWALVFPALLQDVTLSQKSSVFLQLLVQKVLWTTGLRVMLWHNSFNRVTDTATRLSDNDVLLLDRIFNAYCDKRYLKDCVQNSMLILREAGLVRQDMMDTTAAWFDALTLAKGIYPVHPREDTCRTDSLTYNSVDFSLPIYHRTRYSKAPYVPSMNKKLSLERFEQTCSSLNMPKDVSINLTHPWEQFSDVLLIVIFNKAHYEIIPYLELMYRTFFPYMLYCGPGLPNATQAEELKKYKLTLISYTYTPVGHFPGAFNYECVAMAMSMSYSVSGYVVMGDDVLLSIVNLYERKRHLVWFPGPSDVQAGDIIKLRDCRLGMCDFQPHWRFWEEYRQQTVSVMSKLKKGQAANNLYHRCYNQLKRLTGGENRMFRAIADCYYVPQRLAKDFTALAILFRQEKLFLEITVPSILRCLENPEDYEKLSPLLLWEESRNTPWVHFTNKDFKLKSFMHPTKWSSLVKGSADFRTFYCTQVLPFLHDYFGRIRK